MQDILKDTLPNAGDTKGHTTKRRIH